MANPPEGLSDDFLEQILAMPSYAASNEGGSLAGTAMGLQLSSGEAGPEQVGGGGFQAGVFPLGLSLEQGKGGFAKREEGSASGMRFGEAGVEKAAEKLERNPVHLGSLFPSFGHVQQPHSMAPNPPQPFHGQATPGTVAVVPHPPAIRPRVRARRGQATDPHSIAERLRRERIAERMKALQELVPSSNKGQWQKVDELFPRDKREYCFSKLISGSSTLHKPLFPTVQRRLDITAVLLENICLVLYKTDRAAMLDEIVDYVKFLRLQVKVLSMSRLGGAGAVAQLVADTPLPSIEGEASDDGSNQRAWEKWSTDGTEREVAKLMEEDVGAAMQFLQSKALCIMPISLAAAVYHTHQADTPTAVKPEPNGPS